MMYARGCIFAGAAALLASLDGGLATRAEAELRGPSRHTCYIRQNNLKSGLVAYGDRDGEVPIGFEIEVVSPARDKSVACGTVAAVFGDGGEGSHFGEQVVNGLFKATQMKNQCTCTDKGRMEYLEEPFKLGGLKKECVPKTCWEEYASTMFDEARSFAAVHNKACRTKLTEQLFARRLDDYGLWMVDNEYSGPSPRLPTVQEYNEWLVKEDDSMRKRNKKNKNQQPAGADVEGADAQGDGDGEAVKPVQDGDPESDSPIDDNEIDCAAAIQALREIKFQSALTGEMENSKTGNAKFKLRVNSVLEKLGL